MLFTPRLYTEDTWGSILAVDNFHSLPSYHTRTFIFSTRPSMADIATDKLTEWTVDLYPKGVWFRKSMLIVWAGTCDVSFLFFFSSICINMGIYIWKIISEENIIFINVIVPKIMIFIFFFVCLHVCPR